MTPAQLQLFALLVLSSAFLAGCPNQELITKTPTVEDADDQQATCKVAKDPLNPLVVEWPGTSKVDFESSSKRGVVVVSYVGCNMKILSGCQAEGAYDYTPVTPARDRVEMKSQTDLYARLPLAAASLRGELSQGAALELEYIAVGQRIADKPPVSLSGNCDGATHYVRSITVGAFRLDALAAGKAGLGVDVAGAGVGAGREENARKIRSQGDVEKCNADPNAAECGATLQLGLAPLSVGKQGSVTSAGFGAGVGPLGVIPTVSTMTDVSNVGVGSLKDVDLAYLDLVQGAKRADKDATMPPESKAQAWDTLARYTGENPLRPTAEKRREEWLVVAEAQARRRAQLEKLRGQYNADKAKLDKLTSLDDDVVPQDQKAAYRKEFDQVYAPFEADLKEIGAIAGGSASVASESGNTAGTISTPYVSSDSSSSGPDVTEAPMLGEKIFLVRAEFGAHAQSWGQDTEADELRSTYGVAMLAPTDTKPTFDFGDMYVGGELGVNFSGERDGGVGLFLSGRYHLRATLPNYPYATTGGTANLNPNDEATGAFAIGGGLRVGGNIGERVGLNFGFDILVSKFLNPTTTTTCGDVEWDPGVLGGAGNIFLALEYYPLTFMSFGLKAALGFGHAGGQWCVPGQSPDGGVTPGTPVLVDTFADSFSATGTTVLGFHF